MAIDYQDLILLLRKNKNIEKVYERGLRTLGFYIGVKKFEIEWWVNISYLHTDCGCKIPFHTVTLSGTWPNRAKLNLQFYYNKEAGCILPVEHYTKL
jgi:hypothetical protein